MNPCRTRDAAVARQSGVSLVEVLVTIVVLSLGLLGLAGLQANGLRASQGAYYRAQAAQFAFDMADRMRANATPVTAATYEMTAFTNAAGAPSGSTLRERDTREWLNRLAGLPDGRGRIDVESGSVTIEVQWDDRRAAGGTAATPSTFSLQTRLWNN